MVLPSCTGFHFFLRCPVSIFHVDEVFLLSTTFSTVSFFFSLRESVDRSEPHSNQTVFNSFEFDSSNVNRFVRGRSFHFDAFLFFLSIGLLDCAGLLRCR